MTTGKERKSTKADKKNVRQKDTCIISRFKSYSILTDIHHNIHHLQIFSNIDSLWISISRGRDKLFKCPVLAKILQRSIKCETIDVKVENSNYMIFELTRDPRPVSGLISS